MSDEYFRTRRITGEKYNIFDKKFITIMNIQQGAYYMANGCELWDCYPSTDRVNGKPVVAFVFIREQTKDVYDAWCKQKGDK